MVRRLTALALASIAAGLSLVASSAAAQTSRFPEMPRLESLVPPETTLYEQETWSGQAQHCWEWGFAQSARPAIEASLRARVVALGWSDADLGSGTMRRDGAVVAIEPGFPLDRLDPSTTVLKIVLCTEHLAPPESRAQFFTLLEADPLWPALPFGPASTGWRRHYANGAHALGLAFALTDPTEARAWLQRAGYFVISTTPYVEMRSGRARARFSSLMWWQHEDRAP